MILLKEGRAGMQIRTLMDSKARVLVLAAAVLAACASPEPAAQHAPRPAVRRLTVVERRTGRAVSVSMPLDPQTWANAALGAASGA